MRTGVDRHTGVVLTDWDHCRQSIEVILTTAIGSVVMLRDFGSDAPTLQDRPMNPREIGRHFAAVAVALRKWEPGFRLTSIRSVSLGEDGAAGFEIAGRYFPRGHLGDYRQSEARVMVAS